MNMHYLRSQLIRVLLTVTLLLLTSLSRAGTPIDLLQSFSGNIDFVMTGNTLRTLPDNAANPNNGDACMVTEGPVTADLVIPATSTVRSAFLYWAGTSGDNGAGVNVPPDNLITFESQALLADELFTETFTVGAVTIDSFSARVDITPIVSAKGSGTYTFSDLTVQNAGQACTQRGVFSGFVMVVIFEDPMNQPFRVLNIFDGYESFLNLAAANSQPNVMLSTGAPGTPGSLRIPQGATIENRVGLILWEGDPGSNGEAITVTGTPGGGSTTIDEPGINPNGDLFNGTITTFGVGRTDVFGVDADIFDIGNALTAGDTQLNSNLQAANNDLVYVSVQVLSVVSDPRVNLGITKTDTGPFTVGQPGSYTLTVNNNGALEPEPGPVTVTDTLPTGLTFVSGVGTGWVCNAMGQNVTCTNNNGPFAPNVTLAPITLTVDVAAAALPSVNNTARVAGVGFDVNDANNEDTISTMVIDPTVDLSITKVAMAPFTVGQAGSYTLTVSNAGPASETGTITVTDTLPMGLSFVSGVGTGWTCSAIGQAVSCTNDTDLAAGNSLPPITLTVNVADAARPSVDNTASVTGAGMDNNLANNSDTETTAVNPANVDLVIDKAAQGAPFTEGQPAVYTLTVSNNGPMTEVGPITVTDTLPADLTFVSAVGTGFSCINSGQLVTCTTTTPLAAGNSLPAITLTVTVNVGAAPDVTNTASVLGTQNDLVPGNNSDTEMTVVNAPLGVNADLNIDKQAQTASFTVGTNAAFDLVVSNAGPNADPGPITVLDTLPNGLSFMSGTGTNWTCSASGQLVTCTNPGPLAASSSLATLTITTGVDVAAVPSVMNTATVSGGGVDNNLADNTSSTTTPVVNDVMVDLQITIDANNTPFVVGQPGSYTINVSNNGPDTETGLIIITDVLPPGLTFVSALGTGFSCTNIGQNVSCTHNGPLASGQSLPPLTLTVNVGQAALNQVTNSVMVQGQVPDVNLANNQDSVTTPVVPGRTPSVIQLLRFDGGGNFGTPRNVAATQCQSSSGLVVLNNPTQLNGNGIDISNAVSLVDSGAVFKAGETAFIQLTDLDQNLDPNLLETVDITVESPSELDSEQLTLTESGPNTGVFIGFIALVPPQAIVGDCQLAVDRTEQIITRYQDPMDPTDTSDDNALVDPFGVFFNSATGEPVNGATITVIDLDTNQPATVFGDDGVSPYPSTVVSGTSATDASGNTINFEPGGYVFPFLPLGNFAYQITPPAGFSFPSIVDDATLQALPGGPFALIPASRGGSFIIQAGPAVRIDIPLDPAANDVRIQKDTNRSVAAAGDFIQYQITVDNVDPSRPLGQLQINDLLPFGFRYDDNSARVNDQPIADPVIGSDGRNLIFTINPSPTDQRIVLTYNTEVTVNARVGDEAINVATVSGPNIAVPRSATAQVLIRDDLFGNRSVLVGRVMLTQGECGRSDIQFPGVAGVRVFLEDGTYVVTDEQGKWHMEGVTPGTHVVQLDTQSLGKGFNIMPCRESARFSGQSFSQFVELQGGTLWRADFYLVQDKAIADFVPSDNDYFMNLDRFKLGDPSQVEDVTTFDLSYLEKAQGGYQWLWPSQELVTRADNTPVVIKHAAHESVTLWRDDEQIPPSVLDQRLLSKANGLAMTRFQDVELKQGWNKFTVAVQDTMTNNTRWESKNLYLPGPAVDAQIVMEQSELLADGVTPSVVAVRLMDQEGMPIMEGTRGILTIDPPYRALDRATELSQNPVLQYSEQVPYEVGKDGIALISLEPTADSGEATMRLDFSNGASKSLTSWLSGEQRDWILVALGEGTVAHNRMSGNMQGLDRIGRGDEYERDGRVAFFAKGWIKGEWLLTMAYDTDKERQEGRRLEQLINPGTFYLLYGDRTEQGYEAASSNKLYLRLERDQFYALFGDFATGMNTTELSRYNRNLTGFKSEFKGDNWESIIFASETQQGFMRDELRGDGTSGLYRLSAEDIVLGSEKIVLQTRDRFKSEEILEERRLTRHLDYTVDYEDGTLFFKSPIPSKDRLLNPIFMVVTYEAQDVGDKKLSAGGRIARKFGDDQHIGLTLVHEGTQGREGDLVGLDLQMNVPGGMTLKAEIAQTDRDTEAQNGENGNAYMVELGRETDKLNGKVYVRRQAGDFGLNQQNISESATRKIGALGSYETDSGMRFSAEVYEQTNIDTDEKRKVAEALGAWKAGDDWNMYTGLRFARDDGGDIAQGRRSNQLIGGLNYTPIGSKMNFRADLEMSVGGDDENIDYPTRLIFGGDYQVMDGLKTILEQELTWGDNDDTEGTRIGFEMNPWQGMEFRTLIGRQSFEEGARVFANTGLNQIYNYSDQLRFDFSIDRSHILNESSDFNQSRLFDGNVPRASGVVNDDFTATSLGIAYQNDNWRNTLRLEYREGDLQDRYNIFGGAYYDISEGKSLSARLILNDINNRSRRDETHGEFGLGYAFRPTDSRWIIYDRFEFHFDKEDDGAFSSKSRRVINNFNTNFVQNNRSEWGFQYSFKYVFDTISGEDQRGFTDLLGLEYRYDLTKFLEFRARASVRHSYESDIYNKSFGVLVGWNAFKNVWLGVGYNFDGFRDDDFSGSEFTAKGPYLRFRFKADQNLLRDIWDDD